MKRYKLECESGCISSPRAKKKLIEEAQLAHKNHPLSKNHVTKIITVEEIG